MKKRVNLEPKKLIVLGFFLFILLISALSFVRGRKSQASPVPEKAQIKVIFEDKLQPTNTPTPKKRPTSTPKPTKKVPAPTNTPVPEEPTPTTQEATPTDEEPTPTTQEATPTPE